MTRYLLYFLTGFAVATLILFFRSYVAVPPSLFSDVALVGAMTLFGGASWLTLFKVRAGAVLALLCLLTTLPWMIRVWIRALEQGGASGQIVSWINGIVSVLVLISLVISSRYAFWSGSWRAGTTAPGFILKVLLALLPLAVVVAWLIVMPQL